MLKKFTFIQKQGNATITLTAPTFGDAQADLFEIVKDGSDWDCENEDGEEA